MNKLVFLDTETTSLRISLPWEIAMISVEPDPDDPSPELATVSKIRMFIADVDLSEADPFALNIGRFYDRHPLHNGLASENVAMYDSLDRWLDRGTVGAPLPPEFDLFTEQVAMQIVDRWTRGATIVGAVPSFDMYTLELRMRWHGLCPMWNHRPTCVENLVAGRIQWMPDNRLQGMGKAAEQIGIEVDHSVAHTAMGDAELARRIFDEVFA